MSKMAGTRLHGCCARSHDSETSQVVSDIVLSIT
jgi:hypothetical protein